MHIAVSVVIFTAVHIGYLRFKALSTSTLLLPLHQYHHNHDNAHHHHQTTTSTTVLALHHSTTTITAKQQHYSCHYTTVTTKQLHYCHHITTVTTKQQHYYCHYKTTAYHHHHHHSHHQTETLLLPLHRHQTTTTTTTITATATTCYAHVIPAVWEHCLTNKRQQSVATFGIIYVDALPHYRVFFLFVRVVSFVHKLPHTALSSPSLPLPPGRA